MKATPSFVFVVCQCGAEAALKSELGRSWPELRFAYSRPGFVTFKYTGEKQLPPSFDLRSTFARTYGFSLGKVVGSDPRSMAAEVWHQLGKQKVEAIHVWQRDWATPGYGGFEPGITPLATEVGRQLVSVCPWIPTQAATVTPDSPANTLPESHPSSPLGAPTGLPVNQVGRPGQIILDCVLVEPDSWWFGWHQVTAPPSQWPGGIPLLEKPTRVISRAYGKLGEALAWSQLPLSVGDLCVEIGCAPGGAAQLLLERGLRVIGIDPAEVDPIILAHPQFEHWKKRAADIRRKEFRKVKWLFADSNVAPQHTLDAVGDIMTHPEVHIRGVILTLKLPDWRLAEEIPNYVAQVRSWGLSAVQTRQLAFNRQEICLTALRTRRPPQPR
jgi:23S rRNA (cytidine2498-2'-O)-methyltransferase